MILGGPSQSTGFTISKLRLGLSLLRAPCWIVRATIRIRGVEKTISLTRYSRGKEDTLRITGVGMTSSGFSITCVAGGYARTARVKGNGSLTLEWGN